MDEKMMIYRVILRVGYNNAYFDFETAAEATAFAKVALVHSKGCDDTKKAQSIALKIIDPAHVPDDDDDVDVNDIR